MVRPLIVFTFWLGGMGARTQVRFSGLMEIGNQRLKFRDVDVGGVCGAGLSVGKELCRKGASEIPGGGKKRNPWRNLKSLVKYKLYTDRERLHKTWQ